MQRRATRWERPTAALLVALGLVLWSGCGDDPVGLLRDPPADEPLAPVETVASSLERVGALLSDGFVRSLAEAVFAPEVVEEVAGVLGALAGNPSPEQIQAAAAALERIRPAAETAAHSDDDGIAPMAAGAEAEDLSEEAIVEDALSLVVDDALDILIQESAASES